MVVLILSASSCEGPSTQKNRQEKAQERQKEQFTYEMLYQPSLLSALFASSSIMAVKKSDGSYVMFDDEANYNPYIYEWTLAYMIRDRFSDSWGYDSKQLDDFVQHVDKLPNTDHVKDSRVAEVFKKTYYDFKDAPFYEPERKYGIHRYPYGEPSYDRSSGKRLMNYMELCRYVKADFTRIEGDFPEGMLLIVCSDKYAESLGNRMEQQFMDAFLGN